MKPGKECECERLSISILWLNINLLHLVSQLCISTLSLSLINTRHTHSLNLTALMLLEWETFHKVDSRFIEGQYDLIPSVSEAYESTPIPIINPELHVAFSNDSDLVRRTQTISEFGLKIPFLDFSMRRNILVKG